MAIDEINERTIKVLTIAFTDEDGDPTTPTTASYRVDDVGTGTQIRDDTAIDVDTSVDVILTASDTAIIDETRPYETRRITISWEYMTQTSPSETGTGNQEYLVNVKNLSAVTTPSPA